MQQLGTFSGHQLAAAAASLTALGCLSDKTPRQQQIGEALRQGLVAGLTSGRCLAAVKKLLPQLTAAAGEGQVGCGQLAKELETGVEGLPEVLDDEGVLVLVAELQQIGEYGAGAQELYQQRVVKALEALAAGEVEEEGHEDGSDGLGVRKKRRRLELGHLGWVVEAVAAGCATSSSSRSRSGSEDAEKTPDGLQLLHAWLESDSVIGMVDEPVGKNARSFRGIVDGSGDQGAEGQLKGCMGKEEEGNAGGDRGFAPPPPPPPSAGKDGTPPPPPPPPPPNAAAAGAEAAAAAAGGGGGSEGTSSGAAAAAAAQSKEGLRGWSGEIWDAVAHLLSAAVAALPQQLPEQLVQAVVDGVAQEGQAAAAAGSSKQEGGAGGMAACSGRAAVQLLWGLAAACELELPMWDQVAAALDRPGVKLTRRELQQVGSSCLVLHCVLLLSGASLCTALVWCFIAYCSCLVLHCVLLLPGASLCTAPVWGFIMYCSCLVLHCVLLLPGASLRTAPVWCFIAYCSCLVLHCVLLLSGASLRIALVWCPIVYCFCLPGV